MAAKDFKTLYIEEEISSPSENLDDVETSSSVPEENDHNHKKKDINHPVMAKPKTPSKKQLQAAERRRRKVCLDTDRYMHSLIKIDTKCNGLYEKQEMEEIGKQLLEQQKKQEEDKLKEQKKKEKERHQHHLAVENDVMSEIEKQRIQSEMDKIKLETKQKLFEAQDKKKEKRKKKKEMKQTKKQAQHEAKTQLEEIARTKGPLIPSEEDLHTLDDLEPLPKLNEAMSRRKGQHSGLWNLPPRLAALQATHNKPVPYAGKGRELWSKHEELPPRTDHFVAIEQKSQIKQPNTQSCDNKENLPAPLCRTQQSAVCPQRRVIDHDPELTAHHLHQYGELMLVQPERHTQCQLRGKVPQQGVRKADLLRRQQEKEARRNKEEMAEIWGEDGQKHREDWRYPSEVHVSTDWTSMSDGYSNSPGANVWQRRRQLLEELTPESVEDEEAMLTRAMEVSLQLDTQEQLTRYGAYEADVASIKAFCPPNISDHFGLADIGRGLMQNSLSRDFPPLPTSACLDSSVEDLPEGAFDGNKPCPSYTARPSQLPWSDTVHATNGVQPPIGPNSAGTVEDWNHTDQLSNIWEAPRDPDSNRTDVEWAPNGEPSHSLQPHSSKIPHSNSLKSLREQHSSQIQSDWQSTDQSLRNTETLERPYSNQTQPDWQSTDQSIHNTESLNIPYSTQTETDWSTVDEAGDSWDTRLVNHASPSSLNRSGWRSDGPECEIPVLSQKVESDQCDRDPAVKSNHVVLSCTDDDWTDNHIDQIEVAGLTSVSSSENVAECTHSFIPTPHTDKEVQAPNVQQKDSNSLTHSKQSYLKDFSCGWVKINAVLKPEESDVTNSTMCFNPSNVQKTEQSVVEDWGSDMVQNASVTAGCGQTKEIKRETIGSESGSVTNGLGQVLHQSLPLNTASVRENGHCVRQEVMQAQKHENIMDGIVESQDAKQPNQKSTSLIDEKNVVDGSGDHERIGWSPPPAPSPPPTNPNLGQLPGIPTNLPDDLSAYIQYLAQNATLAMLNNPMCLPYPPALPSFPGVGPMLYPGVPMMPTMPVMPAANTPLFQQALQLHHQQQFLMQQQLLQRQLGLQGQMGLPINPQEKHHIAGAEVGEQNSQIGAKTTQEEHQSSRVVETQQSKTSSNRDPVREQGRPVSVPVDQSPPRQTLPEGDGTGESSQGISVQSPPKERLYRLRLPKSFDARFQNGTSSVPTSPESHQPVVSKPPGMGSREDFMASDTSAYVNNVHVGSLSNGVRGKKSEARAEMVYKPSVSGVRFSARGRGHTPSGRGDMLPGAAGTPQNRPSAPSTTTNSSLRYGQETTSGFSNRPNYKSSGPNTKNSSQFSHDRPEPQTGLQTDVNSSQYRTAQYSNGSQIRLPSSFNGSHTRPSSVVTSASTTESWEEELLDREPVPPHSDHKGYAPSNMLPPKSRGFQGTLRKVTMESNGLTVGRKISRDELSDASKRSY